MRFFLADYLSRSMKDSDPIVVKATKKKAKAIRGKTNGAVVANGETVKKAKVKRTSSKLLNNNNCHDNDKRSNGTTNNSPNKSPTSIQSKEKKMRKKIIKKMSANGVIRSNAKSVDSRLALRKNKKKKSNGNVDKSSPELRPRRRASQTYFFKYQLARNPLKAEEEDLKMALLASLEQCGNSSIEPEAREIDSEHNVTKQQNCAHRQPSPDQNSNHKQPNKQSQELTKHPPQSNKAPPPSYDEEYLKKYRPETEDFLSFICFRITAPNYQNRISLTANGQEQTNESNDNIVASNNTGINDRFDKQNITIDSNNLKRCITPQKLAPNVQQASNSPIHLSPSNRRRPTRHSPRLASSTKKISEFDNLNHTAHDNSFNYEEDMKKACIALEDMAHEINASDDIKQETRQIPSDLKPSTRHLVKGLISREFAGAFADEEIIFESISNHKL